MRRGRATYAAAGRRVMCVHRTAAGAACWLGVGWGRERADAPSILQRLGMHAVNTRDEWMDAMHMPACQVGGLHSRLNGQCWATSNIVLGAWG
jgi:hypothetical protein